MKNFFKYCFLLIAFHASAQTPLFIPDTLIGPTYNLNLHSDSVNFLPGTITQTNGFNAYKYLGPTLILNKGSVVNMVVNNQLSDTTTIHWHGLHVAPSNDGGPQIMIMPGATWNPSFTVMNYAATYWYHPHMHRATAAQVMKGAAGLIIVRDSTEALLNIPRKYGIDDIPIIVQSQEFKANNQIDPRGMNDSILLVNGAQANYGNSVFENLPAQVVRMRLLNASQERNFNFGFSANNPFYVIGNDGGSLSAPVLTTRIRLSPGERAEILVNLSGMNGQTLYLMAYQSELTMGIQGGPTMPMPPWSPPMNSPLNGANFNILQFNIGLPNASPVTTIPSSLVSVTPFLEASANNYRRIDITADSVNTMDGPFYFNDSLFDMMRIDYRIPLNSVEVWELKNNTMVAHPFHIHDVEFFILDRDGIPVTPIEAGRKDVVLVPPGDSVRFITKFVDFADTTVPYMFHCHVLMHEDDGMMGQFVVTPSAVGINELKENNQTVNVFPNPAKDVITISINDFDNSQQVIMKFYDLLGKEIYSSVFANSRFTFNVGGFNKGLYTISISQGSKMVHKKIIIQ
jgi:blue copper oxidase